MSQAEILDYGRNYSKLKSKLKEGHMPPGANFKKYLYLQAHNPELMKKYVAASLICQL